MEQTILEKFCGVAGECFECNHGDVYGRALGSKPSSWTAAILGLNLHQLTQASSFAMNQGDSA